MMEKLLTVLRGYSDIINLFLVVGAVLLAITVFFMLDGVRQAQGREHRQRLIDEVINWAINAGNCRAYEYPVEYLGKHDELKFFIAHDLISGLKIIEDHGEYISRISKYLDKELSGGVQDVINRIKEREFLLAKAAAIEPVVVPEEVPKTLETLERRVSVMDSLGQAAKSQVLFSQNAGELRLAVNTVIKRGVELKTRYAV